MRRTFTITLLITCVLLAYSCKTQFIGTSIQVLNISVSDSLNGLDNQVVQLYQPYKNILEKDMNRVISVSGSEMVKDKPESLLTNFLADLLLEEGKNEAEKKNLSLSPSISYFNYGGIRTFLPEGEITVGKIFELMPFENELVYIQLGGDQVQYFLNRIASIRGDCVGGVRFTISNENALNVLINGVPINPGEKYWMVTNDYVASGGDDLQMLARNTQLINSGLKIRDVIISHLEKLHAKGEVIPAKLDGRIKHE